MPQGERNGTAGRTISGRLTPPYIIIAQRGLSRESHNNWDDCFASACDHADRLGEIITIIDSNRGYKRLVLHIEPEQPTTTRET